MIDSHLLQDGTQTHRGGGIFTRAGLNFRLTERSTLGISGFGMISEPKVFNMANHNERMYLLTDAAGDTLRDYTREQDGTGSPPGGNATIDYTFKLNGHELTLTGTYRNFGFNNASKYRQIEGDTLYQDQNSTNKDQGLEVKADYEWKPTPQSRLEAGYNYTTTWGKNFADAHNLDANGQVITELYPYYSEVNARLQNHAVYVTYGNRFWNKLSIQVGLRGEYYMRHVESFYKDGDGAICDSYAAFPNKRDTAYFQLFPSAYISYDFGKGHELQLNYTRRVRRPWGHQINPRMDFSDSTNISYGNVDLLPAYFNNLELNYLKKYSGNTARERYRTSSTSTVR